MRDQLKSDIGQLREIIGDDISVDDFEQVKFETPNLLVVIIWKLFDLLRFLANIPIQGENGEQTTMNVYQ